ncbi:hypothetical protein ACFJGV_03060 [Cnuibacter sp. UC19_7]|uniref:hypothetical protein n=1 Tax=Cnuibacter sp. UC19_7 TaxID=3350166 RepID=UPI0036717281
MSIDWAAFLVVALTSLVATAVVVSLYSLGVRLLGPRRTDEDGADLEAGVEVARPMIAVVGAITCFLLCAAAVLFGIYLIVPFLHG